MYVYSDGQGREPHEDYDNTIYWCLKTMKELRPGRRDGRRARLPQSAAVLLRAVLTRAGGERWLGPCHLNAPGTPTHPRGVSFRTRERVVRTDALTCLVTGLMSVAPVENRTPSASPEGLGYASSRRPQKRTVTTDRSQPSLTSVYENDTQTRISSPIRLDLVAS